MALRTAGSTEGIPKWKIALAIGAPVAVGLAGLWWYRRGKSKTVSKEPVVGVIKPVSIENLGPDPSEKGDAEQTLLEQAQGSKNKGNKFFKGGKYDNAITCYTEAIRVCPEEHNQEMATFYQNRAAAYEKLGDFAKVVDDCTHALTYNKKYTKALFRRAKACEQTGDLMQCLEDVTAVCILESFENQQSLLMADRVLKELGRTKAKEHYKKRGPVEPSRQFIRTYYSTFNNDPILKELEQLTKDKPKEQAEETNNDKEEAKKDQDEEEDSENHEKGRDETPEKEQIDLTTEAKEKTPYELALDQFASHHYGKIVELCSEEIGNSDSPNLPKALLLRATFYHLRGEGNKAMTDLDQLLDITDLDKRIASNALVKRGSLKMQNGEQLQALNDFATAARKDPENSDIYHHRGQLNLLIDRVDDAVRDFEECVKLSPDFAIAHVQKCYTEYRQAHVSRSPMMLQNSVAEFEKTVKQFPDCAEGYALFGQALCDQQQFDKADKNYQKALEVETDNGNVWVHRGLLYLQWKQDLQKASELINKALEVDDKCEFAYETLGTIEVQRGNLQHGIELFNKSISLARTEIEMAHLFSLLDAATAQSRVAENFGIAVPLGGMA